MAGADRWLLAVISSVIQVATGRLLGQLPVGILRRKSSNTRLIINDFLVIIPLLVLFSQDLADILTLFS